MHFIPPIATDISYDWILVFFGAGRGPFLRIIFEFYYVRPALIQKDLSVKKSLYRGSPKNACLLINTGGMGGGNIFPCFSCPRGVFLVDLFCFLLINLYSLRTKTPCRGHNFSDVRITSEGDYGEVIFTFKCNY